MGEGGRDGTQVVDAIDLEVAELTHLIESQIKNDPDKIFHTEIKFLTHDKVSDKPTETHVGNIVATGADDTFVVLLNERGHKQILVINPPGAAGIPDEQDSKRFYGFIHYDNHADPPRFQDDLTYGPAHLRYTIPGLGLPVTRSSLADYFRDHGMLMARSGEEKTGTVISRLSAAYEHGTKILPRPQRPAK